MARVKAGPVAKDRRRKVLKRAKGYFGSKHRLYKTAQEQLFHSGEYSYRDRKKRGNEFRKLWITRINAACRVNGISYSKFINGLSKANILINRKMLSELAISDSKEFAKLVEIAKNPTVKIEKQEKEVKQEKVKTNTKENKSDISSLTVVELKKLAKEKGVAGYTTMKKADLLESLK